MLWIKIFHIFFVVSWFAGLFYLPRIFVNLAMVESEQEKNRLLLMGAKLYRFVTPIGVLTIITGLWLWYLFGFMNLWIFIKTAIVALLAVYHLYCRKLLDDFTAGKNTRSHLWFRVFNELPVFALFAVVALVVLKPF